MLSQNGRPSLLVSVTDDYNPTCFEFYVINGNWTGRFTNGHITILYAPCGAYSSLNPATITCDNQDRLRAERFEYKIVFENYDNINYIAPAIKKMSPGFFADMNDNIAF